MLSDLDELVLKCRDERAKAYVREAVACYKAGAYRSAIISTWIAVAFDIVDKVYELSLAGDQAAESFIKEFQSAASDVNPSRMLSFERNLLSKARDPFELVSPQEYSDLERLRDDRHRCAHPSRVSYTDIFVPSAELARLHLRVAIECLLQHEPAQGKAALKTLVRDIQSKHFPTDDKSVSAFLDKSPLRRARASLVRSVLIVLIKSNLDVETDFAQRRRNAYALKYILEKHNETATNVLKSELSRLFRGLESDDQLQVGARLLTVHPAFGNALEIDQVIRLQVYIHHLPIGEFLWIDEFGTVAQFKDAVAKRVNTLRPRDLKDSPFFVMPNLVKDHIISEFSAARNSKIADAWATVIGNAAEEFNREEFGSILRAAAQNRSVLEGTQLAKMIAAIRARSTVPADVTTLIASINSAAGRVIVDLSEGASDEDIPF